ncbi:hypothetical protein EMIHUDRAFT_458317 [Emiliania huxleyi CCMP1516]|uniref:Uncharacterized protein n=2 Tax=Emiliania huxleyi TaxID=2903 RepID=A0A0D3JDL9_EMIH1|nr:hypothetical protein EMIHUDRAFT_458317 [Emiliania huxleyi CCMP1516]EOD21604.1 hypothetical protein EMIHUDRAFT_458317 [Emiliania huxleyi CCMP1516]|eukprot:XP_005774033.1 hypothetical protein EMIHUDRAFT_458317 [Emiliania huxleyi CCMP1516]
MSRMPGRARGVEEVISWPDPRDRGGPTQRTRRDAASPGGDTSHHFCATRGLSHPDADPVVEEPRDSLAHIHTWLHLTQHTRSSIIVPSRTKSRRKKL